MNPKTSYALLSALAAVELSAWGQRPPPDRFAFSFGREAAKWDVNATSACGDENTTASRADREYQELARAVSTRREARATRGVAACLERAREKYETHRQNVIDLNRSAGDPDVNSAFSARKKQTVPPPLTDAELPNTTYYRDCMTPQQAANDSDEQELAAAKGRRDAAGGAAEQCRAEAERRANERRQAAPTRPLAELRAIPERYRLPEEQARVAQEDAQQLERLNQHRADPKWTRPAMSAALCVFQSMRKDAAGEIAEEKKYARQGGGVVDMQKLYGLQGTMRAADAKVAEVRSSMRAAHLAPLPCSAKLVQAIATCIGPDHEGCAAVKDYADVAPSTQLDD